MTPEQSFHARRVFAMILAAASFGLAIWREMQLLAIASLVALLGALYIYRTRNVVALLQRQVSRVTGAKISEVEVSLDSGGKARIAGLGEVVEDTLQPEELMVLLSTHTTGSYALSGDRVAARRLRDLGLAKLDGPTVSASSELHLTPAGEKVAESVLSISPTLSADSELN